jgi:Ca-activated chloride channel family protein
MIMQKGILGLLIGLAWFQIGHGSALADGMLLPLPEALSPDYLVVRYHHVTVHIKDGHAVTRVEQEFYNPYDSEIEGRYLFPIPPDAILSSFQATVDGRRQEVARQDASATNEALYALVAQQHDPSLFQYADWESFAFDLHLPAFGSRSMSLEYEEVLAPVGGLYRYRYVLSTERYSSLPVEEVSITAEIRSSSGLASVYSSSHAIRTERLEGGRARVTWQARDANPSKDFELFFAPAEGGYGGGLLTGERNDQDHFLFVFSPEVAEKQAETLPKDIVFVIDRSGSMGGEKLEQARDALHHILGRLGKADRFSIVSFDERLEHLESSLVPVDRHTVQSARRFVDDLTADGSTDLEAALQAGLAILEHSEKQGTTQMVVFLTDGLPTAGITDDQAITDRVARTNSRLDARLHVFGVGYDVNSHLLDRLAADNGGTVTYVQPGENLELALTGFYDRIARPLLTDLQIEFEGIRVDQLYPQTLPDLFQGSSLMLTGLYEGVGREAVVRIRGWAGRVRREYVYRYDLGEAAGHDFVPRLWATRRVGALLDRVRVDGEDGALVDEIRKLGLSYGIVTPYTTFVIQAQAGGVASAENMALYGNQAELNQAWGQVTIQARVQNQAYQQSAQADLAVGANVRNMGPKSVAQVGAQQVDLSLLEAHDPGAPISGEWLARHIQVDRTIEFGSEEYFALAADPEARAFLQSGRNAIFAYLGQIIAVQDPHERADGTDDGQIVKAVSPDDRQTLDTGAGTLDYVPLNHAPDRRNGRDRVTDAGLFATWRLPGSTVPLLAVAAVALFVGLAAVGMIVVLLVRPGVK